MNPEKGQYVKVMFNNGQSAEGYVEAWSDNKSVLMNKERSSFLVIQRTEESVLFVKVSAGIARNKYELIEEFDQIANKPNKSRDDLKTLAQLRAELNRQEREDLANMVTSHEFSQMTPTVQYALPKFASQPSPVQHSSPQGSRTRVSAHSGLPTMFQNKNKNKRSSV